MIQQILAGSALIGAIIAAIAYLPQVIHLLRVKDSTGVSVWMWYLWLLSDGLLLAYAININDWVFIAVNAFYCALNIVIIFLIFVYRQPAKQ